MEKSICEFCNISHLISETKTEKGWEFVENICPVKKEHWDRSLIPVKMPEIFKNWPRPIDLRGSENKE